MNKKDEALKELINLVENSISFKEWKLDGRCFPDAIITKAKVALQEPEKDWVIICKRCGDDLGIVFEDKNANNR